ncbi:MAG TPA: metallophosphoesterase [Solirubrobacteraceae bacterium]|nr:metallophosphoesterase [Solirubrobacteraceae bacterium]
MRTLIVSDLHVGTHDRTDVLRRSGPLATLIGALDGVDRLVLLGDAIELRSGPVARALDAARPVFAALGRALDGREVVLVPGNHDHALIAPWAQRRDRPLGLEARVRPAAASPAAAALAGLLGPGARLELAYPGLWVRPDVYATHGHYLDRHITIPTFERLAIGGMGRFLGGRVESLGGPDAYEALVAPVYAWIDAVAQTGGPPGAVNGGGSTRAWRALAAPGPGRRRIRARMLAASFPLAVAGLNRAGLGPLRSDFSGDGVRRARLRAMAEVVDRLAITAAHVVFGHTHRTGPLPGDGLDEWVSAGGARLHNCGSWVFDARLMGPVAAASPYWPGGSVTVDGEGPPRLERLLADYSAFDLGVAS